MSGQGYPINDRVKKRIAVLASDGHSKANIARICGVSDNTVKRVRKAQEREQHGNDTGTTGNNTGAT